MVGRRAQLVQLHPDDTHRAEADPRMAAVTIGVGQAAKGAVLGFQNAAGGDLMVTLTPALAWAVHAELGRVLRLQARAAAAVADARAAAADLTEGGKS